MTQKKQWQPQQSAQDYQLESTDSAHQGHFKLLKHSLKFKKFDGSWSQSVLREQLLLPESVAVILFDPKRDQLVMVEQFRVGTIEKQPAPWLLEIVAGFKDEGESLEQAVMRETKEETNLEIKHLVQAYRYYTSPGGLSEITSVFCGIVDASLASKVCGNDQEQEDILVHALAYEEVEAYFESGLVTSSSTLIAFQWLQIHRAHLLTLDYV